MGREKVEVCDNCGKKECSGKMFWAYDEIDDKVHHICDSMTAFAIREDIFSYAWDLYWEKEYKAASQEDCMCIPSKYVVKAAKNLGWSVMPIVRIYRQGGMRMVAMPKAWRDSNHKDYNCFENLLVPFSQFAKGVVYNNDRYSLKEIKSI